jgi:hypothetical protein
MRRLQNLAVAILAIGGLTAAPVQAQMNGTRHTQEFLSVNPEIHCTLTYQAIAYPGAPNRTVTFNGELSCIPTGVQSVTAYLAGLDPNTGAIVAGPQYFGCGGGVLTCGAPGNPEPFTGNVQVPNGHLVDWHLYAYTMDTDIPKDPWIVTPVEFGCIPGASRVQCLEDFVAHDPQGLENAL